jgi:iron complex transport system substrate-binding protein
VRSPSIRRRRAAAPLALLPLVALIALVAAACGGASPTPSAAPTPAGSTAPAATGMPEPSPSASPAPTANPAAATYPLALTDDEGTAVTLKAQPQRIVSLTPATTEILFAVGAGDRVVGATDVDDYPAAAKSIPRVVNMGKVDIEKIVGLKADLVVAGGNGFNSREDIAKIRSLGIPVLVVDAPDVAGVLKDVQLVANASGEAQSGAALAASMKTGIDAIAASIAAGGATRPKVFYELSLYQGTIYGPADKSLTAEMITLAGGEPITTGSPTAFSIPLEKLVVADPDVIVLGDAAYGVSAEQVATRPGWEGMAAVKAGAIRPIDDVVVTRPGPRLVEGLRALALAINPAAQLPPAPSPSP